MAIFGKKKEIDELRDRISYLEANASTEYKAVKAAEEKLRAVSDSIASELARLEGLKAETQPLQDRVDTLEAVLVERRSELSVLEDAILLQEFGLYEPKFDFLTVDEYKAKLSELREAQKAELKRINDSVKNTSWTVNGSATEGRKMVRDIQKLLMRAFNGECDEIVRKVKFSNVDASADAIEKSAAAIEKFGRVIGIGISRRLVNLKKEEVYVAYEFAAFKEDEKERLRELKAQEREAKKLEKEIEAERKKLDKEQRQYEKALAAVLAQIEAAGDEEKAALEKKRLELEDNLADVQKAFEDVDYREANQKAGYVYVISNIGSFGEDVYKIGMTRRLDPMERVRELGDASVPFDFDVHAMIFSNDAPGLEAALHRKFEHRKLNLVNHRREFFKCSLEEIKAAVLENYDQTVEFVAIPDAEQFRISEKMREA